MASISAAKGVSRRQDVGALPPAAADRFFVRCTILVAKAHRTVVRCFCSATRVRLGSEGHPMETKGKRTSRVGRPPVTVFPQVAVEAPVQVLPPELTEATAAAPPEPAEVVVERVVSPVASAIAAQRSEPADLGDDAFAAIEEARTAMARGFHALSDGIVGLTRCGIDTSARTAIEMLTVKTFSDAITVNASFARASLENWLDGSAKFTELGVKLAVESARPFLARLSKSWNFAPRPGS
jgi:hypothetical protein